MLCAETPEAEPIAGRRPNCQARHPALLPVDQVYLSDVRHVHADDMSDCVVSLLPGFS